jgi:sulfate adenylyltransferase (ADP) / ATP adenylyltransferase
MAIDPSLINPSFINKTLLLEPGTLPDKVMRRTNHAIESGALVSIPTEYEFVQQDGIQFLVRMLVNLARKEEAKQQTSAKNGKDFNPFLPYEEDLFVADISKTHVCLLNKYNVVDQHILIVTRSFEEQTSLLTLQDFVALWACLAEYDGLAFYNGGEAAGASQRHKHLQLVPYLVAPDVPSIPIETYLTARIAEVPDFNQILTLPELPFVHAATAIDPAWLQSPGMAAAATLERYYELLTAVRIQIHEMTPDRANSPSTPAIDYLQAEPYNLLVTRRWMLLIPRSQASFQGIPVNSLGFAGALLVRNPEQLATLKTLKPLSLLRHVAIS